MTTADDATPARLRDKPTWLISQVSALAHRLLADRLATAGARGYHYRLLAALQEAGPGSQAQLGRRAGLDRSDVAAALNELAGQGYITRSPTPATAAATSSRSPRPGAASSSGWMSCSRRSRMSCSPRSQPASASN